MTPHTSLNDKINTATESIHRSTLDHHTNQHISIFDQHKDQYPINKHDTVELTILYYKFKTYFYLWRQQNVM